MRRVDREVKDVSEILEIIKSCASMTLALMDGDEPYLLPMNYGFDYVDEKLTFYLHCAHQGKKLDIIRKNENVWFSMDTDHHLLEAEMACAYSMFYASVKGKGKISIVDDVDFKIKALNEVMKQYAPEKEFVFEEKHTKAVTVLKIEVESFTAKRKDSK